MIAHIAGKVAEKFADCITLPIYKGLYDVINQYFDSISLEDIITKQVSNFTYNI